MTKTKTPGIAWRAAYDSERDELEGQLAATTNNEPSLTQQSFKDDADINVLVRRFGLDNMPIPPYADDPSYYGDFTNVPDLRTALELVRDAENRFMDLDAKLRAKFDNNPAKLWHWINDPDNGPEAVRLGLLRAPEPPAEKAGETPPAKDTP